MKIEINDFFLTETFDGLRDEIVKSVMRQIIEDEQEWLIPEDDEYYENLKVAAAYIYNHHALHDDHYEIEEWPE